MNTLQDLQAILEYDLDLERQAIKHYTERIQQAEAVGQIGLRVQLESLLADETDHAEAIARLLGK
jgi:bacterioferritin